ncbi:MAG: prepilin-type N-terminal cleavage/methylation domain-containing protein [Succinivibrionaceae bacterium]|nr:prepilin-type N-terminal cleavage/methylation domain-containing protein [Succinivibrionaceae bacterium]
MRKRGIINIKFTKSRSGFTLIELIVVIVILGILAVTAAPKFIDLQKDAKIATLEGLKGAYESALKLAQSKAILQGKEKASCANICINSSQCPADMSSLPCSNSSSDIQAYPGVIQMSKGNLNSNTAVMSLQRIVDYDSDGFIFSSCGPAGNICMMTRGSTQSCCSFVGAQFSRDSDACMLHFWLYAENTKVQVIDGGC